MSPVSFTSMSSSTQCRHQCASMGSSLSSKGVQDRLGEMLKNKQAAVLMNHFLTFFAIYFLNCDFKINKLFNAYFIFFVGYNNSFSKEKLKFLILLTTLDLPKIFTVTYQTWPTLRDTLIYTITCHFILGPKSPRECTVSLYRNYNCHLNY